MYKQSYYIINGITFYRLIAAPFLVLMVFAGWYEPFSWLLAVSFFTDAIDGYLARRYKVTSVMGARVDSIADDLTIGAAIIGMIIFKPEFIKQEAILLGSLVALYVIQTILAFVRYGKMTSFHTYAAKVAAVCQGVFLILFFFLPQPVNVLFYLAVITTFIDVVEEIILVLILPHWEANVKGLYWVMLKKK